MTAPGKTHTAPAVRTDCKVVQCGGLLSPGHGISVAGTCVQAPPTPHLTYDALIVKHIASVSANVCAAATDDCGDTWSEYGRDRHHPPQQPVHVQKHESE